MVAFYKHDIPAWMDGTESLSDGAYRVYHVVIQLIMLNEGPIVRNDRGIAGRANQTMRTVTRHLDDLLTLGKLVLDGGKLANARASDELVSIRQNRVNAGKGGKISGNRRQNLADLPDAPAKSLIHNDPSEAALNNLGSLREERREESPKAPKGAEPTGFASFRSAYPKRNTAFPAKPAEKRWREAMKRGADPEAIIAGAIAYAAEQARIGKIGTEFVKTADVWLNQQRWQDYTAIEPPPKPPAPISDETWRERVHSWRARCGYWPWAPSPPPDDPRTLVPTHILDEFGLAGGEQIDRKLQLRTGAG